MRASYAVCGVGLQFDAPVAALENLPRPGRIDIRVTLGSLPPGVEPARGHGGEYFVDPELDASGRPWMSAARVGEGRYYRLSYAEGVTIVVSVGGEAVWVAWREGLGADDACVYLTGSALGFVLRLRGIACLHGSAVAVAGDAVAVLGPSGSGKSTTAAAFARSGHAVLSDDLIALREAHAGFMVEPAIPRVGLWPESARALAASWSSLPPISARWDKRSLSLVEHGLAFQRTALRLGALYFLGEREPGGRELAIVDVKPAAALIALVADSHGAELVGSAERAAEFDALARLVRSVPCRRVAPCAGLARIPELSEAIARDYRRIREQAVAPLAGAA